MEDVTLEELRRRLGDDDLTLLDVRSALEFEGMAGAHCDPRQGHIPGAVNLPLERIVQCRSAEEVRSVVGLPEGAEIGWDCPDVERFERFGRELDVAFIFRVLVVFFAVLAGAVFARLVPIF